MVRFIGFLLIAFLTLSSNAFADDARPLHIEINEIGENAFELQWKIPPSVPAPSYPHVYLDGCSATTNKQVSRIGASIVQKQAYHCDQAHPIVTIEYPRANPSISTIIRFHRLSGEDHTKLMSQEELTWRIPEKETATGVAKDYTYLGMIHIWKGFDHLLFLACLIMIAGTGRRVLITVTGFTLAHSITLALSALEVVHVAVPPVEAVIALSIVFLATEIIKERRDTLTWRYPIAVSASFGLLHGLGFAAVLNEIGLPQTELATGLLFFNVGVEIGQVIFVLAVFAFIKTLLALKLDINKPFIEKPTAYAVGILATYWMIERTAGFWV